MERIELRYTYQNCLKGELNFIGFNNLKAVTLIDHELTVINLANCPNLTSLNLQDNRHLTKLELINLSQLKEVYCYHNQLAELVINNCPNLEDLSCRNNQLANLIFFLSENSSPKLKKLCLSHNSFTTDLSLVSKLTNLEELDISGNNFTGSLAPLRSLNKLKRLDISLNNDEIDSGLEYLSNSIDYLFFSHGWGDYRRNRRDRRILYIDNKTRTIEEELRKFGEPEDDNFATLLKLWQQANLNKSRIGEQSEKQQLLNELEQLVAGTENQLTTEEQMQLLNNLREETSNEKDNNLEKAEEELTKSLTTQKRIEFTNLANKLETLQITSISPEEAAETKIEISPENQKR